TTSDEKTMIQLNNGQGKISCSNKDYNFFRAFSLFIEHSQKQASFSITENTHFRTIGPMFDLSRNTVMNMESFKAMLRKLAMMGFNTAMLYMEDTYEIKGEPYFGYMRGRYSEEELRELDSYAADL